MTQKQKNSFLKFVIWKLPRWAVVLEAKTNLTKKKKKEFDKILQAR